MEGQGSVRGHALDSGRREIAEIIDSCHEETREKQEEALLFLTRSSNSLRCAVARFNIIRPCDRTVFMFFCLQSFVTSQYSNQVARRAEI